VTWQLLKIKILALDFCTLLALSVLVCPVFVWIGARLVRVHWANILKAILGAAAA
jgi:hypothetical protein